MKVLVSAASKYGATREIAEVLAAKGLEVTVIRPPEVGAVEEFDAVVLGSAVDVGQWMKPARELAERSAAALAARPVWLFPAARSASRPSPSATPWTSPRSCSPPRARDHHVFTGKLARKHLSFPDRAVASAIHAAGDDSATGPKSAPGQPGACGIVWGT